MAATPFGCPTIALEMLTNKYEAQKVCKPPRGSIFARMGHVQSSKYASYGPVRIVAYGNMDLK